MLSLYTGEVHVKTILKKYPTKRKINPGSDPSPTKIKTQKERRLISGPHPILCNIFFVELNGQIKGPDVSTMI